MIDGATGIVTVDLDSTLADTGHRHAMIDRVNGTDWNAYSRACVDDDLVEATALLVRLLSVTHDIHYVSGRTSAAEKQTWEWLIKHRLPASGLWLSEDEDHYAAHGGHAEYKLHRIRQVESATGQKVVLHVDDWAEVKHVLELNGIPCLCVRTPQEILALVQQEQELA